MSKIKVVISGLLFPLTMLSYFWRAFERREDVDLFVTGPYFDDYIPWNYGMKLPRKYVKVPNYPLPTNSAQMPGKLPAEFIQPKLPWKPDLWLQIDAGWHLANRPDAKVVGHVQTDPHVLKGLYAKPKSYSDISWCMQGPYLEKGEKFLPYGYDPTIHYPEEKEKIYDACLIGLHYEHRDRLVARLRARGLNVYYSIGEVYDDYREKYCQSKIALSWSSKDDLPARVWESMAMGVPLVTNLVPDMGRFFINGTDYLGFTSIEEAEKQVMRLMVDDEFRKEIGENGLEAVAPHTWDDRVEQILEDARLI